MTNGLKSHKVIIILSEEYKEKAEAGSGGVGREYNVISQDILISKNKYILVSFDGLEPNTLEKIVPKLFLGYDIVDLVEDEKEGFIRLLSKINDTRIYNFAELKSNIPIVQEKTIPSLKNIIKKINIPNMYNTHATYLGYIYLFNKLQI